MASVILGEWTHRRGDPGGARAVPAEIDKPRPKVTWSWRPEHGGRVDQVRIAAQNLLVATMMPRDATAPGWEHAVVYAIDLRTGTEVARRVLPDPVPVAAMVVGAGVLNVVATRKGEPIFWYGLSVAELTPCHRHVIGIEPDARHEDVLEAWASADGGLWLEVDAVVPASGRRVLAHAFATSSGAQLVSPLEEGVVAEGAPLARDGCARGLELFSPVPGSWTLEGAVPPAVSRLSAAASEDPRQTAWATATLVGPRAQIHTLGAEGTVYVVAAADDPERPERASVEAFAVDQESSVVRWRTQGEPFAVKPRLGEIARIARRPCGELLFQSLGADGAPCTPLVCARPDGRLDVVTLGIRGRYVLDAALGDTVLAHREREGRVEVGGFAIDRQGRLLGRRAALQWTADTGDLGGGTTVYAGAGAVVVRGTRAVCAVTL